MKKPKPLADYIKEFEKFGIKGMHLSGSQVSHLKAFITKMYKEMK